MLNVEVNFRAYDLVSLVDLNIDEVSQESTCTHHRSLPHHVGNGKQAAGNPSGPSAGPSSYPLFGAALISHGSCLCCRSHPVTVLIYQLVC
jgi:hypothetical protein